MDDARVIAIEPHPENFALLQTNLAPYGSRARLCAAAVWSHESHLCPHETTYRDGRHWAYQIRECTASEPAGLRGMTIDTILAEHAEERIALLKMDIEGAEAVVFGPSANRWLHRVDAMLIELHDDSAFGDASQIVAEACGRQFELRPGGHVMVGRRRAH
jgi:FkbM family methyltransferase